MLRHELIEFACISSPLELIQECFGMGKKVLWEI